MIINEGLRTGDLIDLVNNTLSIDEYFSKIDNKNIVVAFYLYDKDPALDLMQFIDKSEISILDADISTAPDPDGSYIVFVEFERTTEFPKRLINLLDSIKGLTSIDNWYFVTNGKLKKHKCTIEILKKNIKLKNIKKENLLITAPNNIITELFDLDLRSFKDNFYESDNIIAVKNDDTISVYSKT